jgi:hypothetical protein
MRIRGWVKQLARMSGRERLWAEAALGAIYPPLVEARVPGITDLGLGAFLDDFEESAPLTAVLGVRAATAIVALAPPVVLGRLCSILGLDADERDVLVGRLAESKVYTVRQALVLLKATGAFLYGADPAVREHMGERLRARATFVALARLLRPRAA